MTGKRSNNRVCSRCHISAPIDWYTRDTTICDPCLEIKPKGQQRKGKKIVDPDEVKFSEWLGEASVYL